MRVNSILIILLILVLSAACKTSKNAVNKDEYIATLSLNDRYNYLVDDYSEWDNVYMPVKVNLIKPQKMSFSARVTMNRNKNILFSLRFIGMEVGSIYITSDSIYGIDKIHKYYLAESIKGMFKGYDVTMSDIQNILLGQVFMEGHGTMKKSMRKKIDISESDLQWFITPKKQPDDVNYFFTLRKNDNRLSILSIKHMSFPQVDCYYEEYEKTQIGDVAGSTTIVGRLGSTPIEATIDLSPKRAEWNFTKDRSWKYPKGYTKITAEQLLKAFTSQTK